RVHAHHHRRVHRTIARRQAEPLPCDRHEPGATRDSEEPRQDPATRIPARELGYPRRPGRVRRRPGLQGRRLSGIAEHLRLIVDRLSDGIILFDREGTCEYLNPEAVRIVGKAPSQAAYKYLPFD